jgi:hypothetical protein
MKDTNVIGSPLNRRSFLKTGFNLADVSKPEDAVAHGDGNGDT